MRVELLFQAEAALRQAALAYAEKKSHTHMCGLRQAACEFGDIARAFEIAIGRNGTVDLPIVPEAEAKPPIVPEAEAKP